MDEITRRALQFYGEHNRRIYFSMKQPKAERDRARRRMREIDAKLDNARKPRKVGK